MNQHYAAPKIYRQFVRKALLFINICLLQCGILLAHHTLGYREAQYV